ncbi:MAG: FliA/WhiG family RNA polymerase sigma factor [Pseudomonadota bacterium]
MFQKKNTYKNSTHDTVAHTASPRTFTPHQVSAGSKTRDDIIVEYAPFIKYIASRLAFRLPPHIDINDIINSGVLGLMDALDKFDTAKGVKFKTYAEFRIRGAILDNLRSMDWVPRSIRKAVSQLEKTFTELEKKLNRPATDEEVAAALNIDTERYYEVISQANGVSLLSLEMISNHEDARLKLIDCLTDEEGRNPLTVLKLEEVRDIIAEAITTLPEKEKMVTSLYYYDDLTMKEISRILSLTESRVSQIHTKAILRLRGKLKEKFFEQ